MNKNRPNAIRRLEDWSSSPQGQRLLNRLYAWGAAIVILGALMHFLEWQMSELFLLIGMGTEIIVFFVAGFEPPASANPRPVSIPELGRELERIEQSITSLSLSIERMNAHRAEPKSPHHADTYAEINEQLERINQHYSSAELDSRTIRLQTERMAQLLLQLNQVYARMIESMTARLPADGVPDNPHNR